MIYEEVQVLSLPHHPRCSSLRHGCICSRCFRSAISRTSTPKDYSANSGPFTERLEVTRRCGESRSADFLTYQSLSTLSTVFANHGARRRLDVCRCSIGFCFAVRRICCNLTLNVNLSHIGDLENIQVSISCGKDGLARVQSNMATFPGLTSPAISSQTTHSHPYLASNPDVERVSQPCHPNAPTSIVGKY